MDSDVRDLLDLLVAGLRALLGDKLVAVYLTGSLSYGDFDRGSSDIDLLIALSAPLSTSSRAAVADLHGIIAARHPEWATRVEASYVTAAMLASPDPPTRGRPYVNAGRMWDPDPHYGNEWLLNLYVLHSCGIALYGPPAATLLPPVDITVVRAASRRDFHAEWEPLLENPAFLTKSHHQAYVTLTLCRILHRAVSDAVTSKRAAAAWVIATYGAPWRALITAALTWQHGQTLSLVPDILNFIRFVNQELRSPTGDSPLRVGQGK